MNNWQKVTLVKKIILLPINIILWPISLIVGVLICNFENEWDRNYFKKSLRIW